MVRFGGATFSGGTVNFSLATFSGGTVRFDTAMGPAPDGLLAAVDTPPATTVSLPAG
nr:hypothetical protein OG781_22755 [Streptomyces sp. NBC_00830]